MSCMLRISGEDFDVDKFISESEWKDLDTDTMSVHRKGEYINDLKRRVHSESGFQIVVSKASFENFKQQQEDAIAFLNKYRKSFLKFSSHPTTYWQCLDFGLDTWPSNYFSKTYILASELMRLCGEYNIDVWMSNYFTRHDGRKKSRMARYFLRKQRYK